MNAIDLRSDTVTLPTKAMRQAMAAAEVGDDVFGEDPTVAKLETLAAEMTGKEAALLVPSGTMANLVSLLTHCGRGDEVLLGDQAHIFYYEQGGSAAVGGIHPRTVPNQPDGTMDLAILRDSIRADNVHFPRTRLIAIENTHNRCSGAPLPPDHLRAVAAIAAEHGLALHMDGARIFNAAAALEMPVADLAGPVDSLSFCLSKGLSAPVGSLICGRASFIRNARRNRKLLGGGMRQAGVIAAAGIVALREMPARLPEDHANARRLAEGLNGLRRARVDPERVRTNIVYIDLEREGPAAAETVTRLAEEGLRVGATGGYQLRAVTHHGIGPGDIDRALKAFARILG
jgi:threonine aldolase